MNTDGRVMSWFFDEYSKFEGFSPGVVTGKVCLSCGQPAGLSHIMLHHLVIHATGKLWQKIVIPALSHAQ